MGEPGDMPSAEEVVRVECRQVSLRSTRPTTVFPGHDEAWPSEDALGFPLPVFTRTSSARMTEEMQQDAAGVWGVPRFSLPSPKNGGSRGLKTQPRVSLYNTSAVLAMRETPR